MSEVPHNEDPLEEVDYTIPGITIPIAVLIVAALGSLAEEKAGKEFHGQAPEVRQLIFDAIEEVDRPDMCSCVDGELCRE